MKDNLKDLLQQRFSGHEAPVDPGTWEAISSGLGSATGETLRQALQQKFSGHEVNVDPGVWNNISDHLGHGAGAGTGTGIGTGWMAAGIGALVLTGGLLWYGSQAPAEEAATKTVPEQQVAEVKTNEAAVQTTTNAEQPQASPENVALPARTPSASGQANEAPRTRDMAPVPGPGIDTVKAILQAVIAEAVAAPKPPEPEKNEVMPPLDRTEMPDRGLEPPQTTAANTTDTGNKNSSSNDQGEANSGAGEELGNTNESSPNILIPNVFTPNFDGVNDGLRVSVDNVVPAKITVKVFSARTASLVFSSMNLDKSWDGRDLSGTPCEPGFYFYAIELVDADGHTYTKGETVRLIRQ